MHCFDPPTNSRHTHRREAWLSFSRRINAFINSSLFKFTTPIRLSATLSRFSNKITAYSFTVWSKSYFVRIVPQTKESQKRLQELIGFYVRMIKTVTNTRLRSRGIFSGLEQTKQIKIFHVLKFEILVPSIIEKRFF